MGGFSTVGGVTVHDKTKHDATVDKEYPNRIFLGIDIALGG